MSMQPADVMKLIEKHGAKMVDFKFVDLLGIWQHTTMPIAKRSRTRHRCSDGYFFDGSSRSAGGKPDPRLRHCDLHP